MITFVISAPGLPHFFYGTIFGEGDIPVGTEITAKVGSESLGNPVGYVGANNKYGTIQIFPKEKESMLLL